MVDKGLLEILICPVCGEGTSVVPDEADSALVCVRCGRRYPVRAGIPVMLVEEAVLPGEGRGVQTPGRQPGSAAGSA